MTKKMGDRFVVGMIVKNRFGVLSRIAGLMSKRAFNIESIAAGELIDNTYTRLTIVARGDDYVKDQVVKQFRKLVDVKDVYLFDDQAISIEHALIKIAVDKTTQQAIHDLIVEFSGRIMDFGVDFVTTEISGPSRRIDAFIALSKAYGIKEMCRSGVITVARGTAHTLSASA